MPGHTTALLAVYPQYSCSGQKVEIAKCGGIYPIVLCPGNEKTYWFIEDLLDEMCQLFTSTLFHIGGDETPKKEWAKCERCQKKIRENNLNNEIELQGYFTNRVVEMLEKRGKQAICWNDSLEAGNLFPKIIIQYWSVQYAEFIPEFLRAFL